MAEIKGLQEFFRTLERLPEGVGQKGAGPFNSALRKGANVVRDAAKKRTAGYGPGNKTGRAAEYGRLTDNISTRKDPDPESNGLTHRYSVSYGRAFWGKYLELGNELMHRDYPKRPFLRPAFEESKDEMLKVVGDELWRQIRILSKRAQQ
jgi:HK97 gp10 family phage protein